MADCGCACADCQCGTEELESFRAALRETEARVDCGTRVEGECPTPLEPPMTPICGYHANLWLVAEQERAEAAEAQRDEALLQQLADRQEAGDLRAAWEASGIVAETLRGRAEALEAGINKILEFSATFGPRNRLPQWAIADLLAILKGELAGAGNRRALADEPRCKDCEDTGVVNVGVGPLISGGPYCSCLAGKEARVVAEPETCGVAFKHRSHTWAGVPCPGVAEPEREGAQR